MDTTTGPTPWARVVGLALGVSLVIGVLVTAFAWPSVRSEPHEVPLAVAGPQEVAAQVEARLGEVQPDGFDVVKVPGEAAAREAIANREVYGAIISDPNGPPTVLTASAGSPAVAGVLSELAAGLPGEPGSEAGGGDGGAIAVQDVVPLPESDPRGVGLTTSVFPMAIGGMVLGVAMTYGVRGTGVQRAGATGARRRVLGAWLGAAGGGVVTALVAQTWLGSLAGNWWANAGVVAMVLAAISTAVIGLVMVLRQPGIAIAALLFIVLGNPLSGVTSAPEMLPSGWGEIGQSLPLGAGGSLLRSTAYFDGAAAGGPLLVLSGWIALGLVLVLVGMRASGGTRNPGVAEGRSSEPATAP